MYIFIVKSMWLSLLILLVLSVIIVLIIIVRMIELICGVKDRDKLELSFFCNCVLLFVIYVVYNV